jgi:hypothetical protein
MVPLVSDAVAVRTTLAGAVNDVLLLTKLTTGNDAAALTVTETAFEIADTPVASVATAVKL